MVGENEIYSTHVKKIYYLFVAALSLCDVCESFLCAVQETNYYSM